jgi:hypothetical protein
MLTTAISADRTTALEHVPLVVELREPWEQLFAQLPAPHFTQSWVYGEGKRAQGWDVERLVFARGAEPVALCQVLVKRLLGVRVAARVNRGPLFLPGVGEEQQRATLQALRRRWRWGRRGLLLIAPALEAGGQADALLRGAGFVRRRPSGWGSALIDLEAPLDTIRARLSSKWRNHLNGSLKADLTLDVRTDRDGFEWMLERHAHNMARKGFAGPAVEFVRRMVDASPTDFRVFEARQAAEPVCGILVARFGRHAETFLSWTGDAGRRSNAHHFLLWHVLVEMKRVGAHALDLGGYTTTDKYGAYKRGMKGREYRLAGEWLAV